MGWTVHYRHNSPQGHAAEKAEIVNLFTPAENSGVTFDVLQASKVGSVWYVAVRMTGANPAPYIADADGSFVFCAVILTSRKNGEWGYKDMTETMGPVESKAPASILAKLSPLDDSDRATYAREWRARCRAYAARVKPRHGDRVKLAEPVPFTGLQGQKVDVQDVECTFYMRRGKKRTCYRHPDVGLLRLRPEHLTGATIV